MKIEFKKLSQHVQLPKYATEGSAGFDLIADNFKTYYKADVNEVWHDSDNPINNFKSVIIYAGDRLLVGCGFSVAIPKGYVMDIRSRSGVSLKSGLIVLNAPGTIDEDYRGEIGVILMNTSGISNYITKGDKIAQGLILEYKKAEFQIVEELDATTRGEGGFGHTDKPKI